MEQRGRDPDDPCETDSSKRGDPDRAEALSGKNSITFLPKRGGKEFMNHIVIIGFMGSGKTRVGKRLAKDLGLPFIGRGQTDREKNEHVSKGDI